MNEIICGDNIEIMKKMKEGCIDLVVTSPPYDNLRSYKNNTHETWGEHVWKPVLEQLYRVMKDGGVVVWIVGDATIKGSETGTSFRQALYAMECGFNLHDTMIYRKVNPMPSTFNRYIQSFEYMFILSKGKPKAFNPITIPCKFGGKKSSGRIIGVDGERTQKKSKTYNKTKYMSNIFEYSVGRNDGIKHPARFPEQLANDHIISWSNEGDIVFDPFVGSGTTCKMAKLNNRNYIGVDISEEYCEIARQRLEECE